MFLADRRITSVSLGMARSPLFYVVPAGPFGSGHTKKIGTVATATDPTTWAFHILSIRIRTQYWRVSVLK